MKNKHTWSERIHWMNKTFNIEINDKPTDLRSQRLDAFKRVLQDEIHEFDDAVVGRKVTHINEQLPKIESRKTDLVKVADTLGDLLVYVLSEAVRWGIPIDPVFHAIMDSQESKLVDGKPLMAPDNSKFIKGPNYQPPEEEIARILEAASNHV